MGPRVGERRNFQNKTCGILPGEIFGKLMTIEIVHGVGINVWKCLCECNSSVLRTNVQLTKNVRTSCNRCSNIEPTNKKDLSGRKFGLWEVIGESDKRGIGRTIYWVCLCTGCGVLRQVNGQSLRNGTSKRCRKCACMESGKTRTGAPQRKFIDLTGKVFGSWTVLGRSDKTNGTYWLCECACGAMKQIEGQSLRRKGSHSCQKCAAAIRGKRKAGFYSLNKHRAKVRYRTWKIRLEKGWDQEKALVTPTPARRKAERTTVWLQSHSRYMELFFKFENLTREAAEQIARRLVGMPVQDARKNIMGSIVETQLFINSIRATVQIDSDWLAKQKHTVVLEGLSS